MSFPTAVATTVARSSSMASSVVVSHAHAHAPGLRAPDHDYALVPPSPTNEKRAQQPAAGAPEGAVRVSLSGLRHRNDPINRAKLARYRALMAEIDVNGDGQIDQHELALLMDKFFNEENRSALFKGFAIIMVAFSVLVVGAVFGLSFAVVNLTKDVQTKDGALTDKSGTPVMTYAGAPAIELETLPPADAGGAGRRLLQITGSIRQYNLKTMFGTTSQTSCGSVTKSYTVNGQTTTYTGSLCLMSTQTGGGVLDNLSTSVDMLSVTQMLYYNKSGTPKPNVEATDFGVWMAKGLSCNTAGVYSKSCGFTGSASVTVIQPDGSTTTWGANGVMTSNSIGRSSAIASLTYPSGSTKSNQRCYFFCTSNIESGYRAANKCFLAGCINTQSLVCSYVNNNN
eukprot:tig00000350_g24348.t1